MPGEQDRFATAVTVPGEFNTSDVRMVQQTISLGMLCNSNKQVRIKFVIMSIVGNREINSCITTIEDLESGKTTLDCGHNTTLVFDSFEVM